MKPYKIDRKRGFESNRRGLRLEGKERGRAKKESVQGQSEPSNSVIEKEALEDIDANKYDKPNLFVDGLYDMYIHKTYHVYMYIGGKPHYAEYNKEKGFFWQLTILDPVREEDLTTFTGSISSPEAIYKLEKGLISAKIGLAMKVKPVKKTIYLIDRYDRFCPENNNGEFIVAAFSTLEKAQAYVDKKDPKDKKGIRSSGDGLTIQERELDKE